MPLADDIEKLREDGIASLDASHDYFTHTQAAWRIVQQFVREGNKATIHNQETGSVVQESDLPRLAQQIRHRLSCGGDISAFCVAVRGFQGQLSLSLTQPFPGEPVRETDRLQDRSAMQRQSRYCASDGREAGKRTTIQAG